MAGDWIKIEKATLVKPEVLAISEILGLHPVHVFGLCVRFWMWCDDQLSDGNAKSVTKVTLDYVIGQNGMTDALIKVGWLRDRSGSLEVPHFDRHLSECSKNRALTKDRVRKSKEKGNANGVTKVTLEPLLEKRREEKRREVADEEQPPPLDFAKSKPDSPYRRATMEDVYKMGRGQLPPISDECCEKFFDRMVGEGWINKQGFPLEDWRGRFREWSVAWATNAATPNKKNK